MNGQTRNFWSRLTHSLRDKFSGNGHTMDDLTTADDQGIDHDGVGGGESIDSAAERPGVGTLSRWARRDLSLTKLQEGYEQVSGLVSDIQQHMSTQSQRTDRICTALEQLAQSTGDLPEISRKQVDMLEAIAGQLETSNVKTQNLTEVVAELPEMSRTQAQTLASINQQIALVQQHSAVSSEVMDRLGQAIHTVGESSTAQAEVLRQMNTSSQEHNDKVNELIAGQTRRFTMLFVITLFLAVAGVAATFLALTMAR